VVTVVLKVRLTRPAVVMILCHEQDSVTSGGSRRTGQETVNCFMSRCELVDGTDLEEEECDMVLHVITDFKIFSTTA
jgi:hypothetical protein